MAYGDAVTVTDAKLALQQAMAKLKALSPQKALDAITAGALRVPPTATLVSTQDPNFWQALNSPVPSVSGPAMQTAINVAVAALAVVAPPVAAFIVGGEKLASLFGGAVPTTCTAIPGFRPAAFWPYKRPAGFAAAEIVPLLADATSYAAQCWSAYYSGDIGYNTYVALLAYTWNSASLGSFVDCFVPLLNDPTKGDFQAGYTVNGTVIPGLSNGHGGSPFLYAVQAPYAFQPLSQVPREVLAPGSTATGQPVSNYEYKGGNYSQGAASPTWSRIRVKSGPLTAVVASTVAKVALGTSAVVIAAPFAVKWATGKSLETFLKGLIP